MAARTIGEQIHPEHSTHPEIGRRLPPLHDPPSFLIGMSPHSNVKRIDLPGRAVKTALYPPPFQSAADTQYSTMRSGMQPFRYPPSEAVRAASGRSEEHTSELKTLMRISYAVFRLNKKNTRRHKE